MKKILVIDDDPIERRLLQTVLGKVGGFEVITAENGQLGLERAVESVGTVILDLQLPDLNGMEVLRKLKSARPQLPVLMLTGVTDIQKAVEATQAGAYTYLTKPFENDQLLITVKRAMENSALLEEMDQLRKRAGKGPALSRILGKGEAILAVMGQIQKVADSTLTVLIQGETGTGKELVARALHEESTRRDKPFVAVDCGALAENLLESELFGHEKGAFTGADRKKDGQLLLAQGGTLFLDEVGNLPLGLQAKLLRVLQERQVKPVGAEKALPIDVRFIAATNAPLEEEAKAAKFRQDLYYRLAEFTLHLPPLRERMEDLPFLAQKFLEEASVEFRKPVHAEWGKAASPLLSHSWPGNIRELRNVIRQAVLLANGSALEEETIKDLLGKPAASVQSPGPVEVPLLPGQSLKQIAEAAVEEAEKQAIRNTLKATGGNKAQAAKLLKTDYKTLHVKVKKYGLQTKD
ncbi:MAG TPA: sigma-54 dependent transcriptional regulator [bacterium]|nr:sigma-54 dependent transcriptional regulator [bacterium]